MAKKNHTVEQIIGKLREAEVRLGQGENRPVARLVEPQIALPIARRSLEFTGLV